MMLDNTPPLVIFAIGNESRGDDALAPLLLRSLPPALAARSVQFECLEEFQLQIEHVLDLQNRTTVLFIDAGMDTPAPFAFYRIQADQDAMLYSHALTPAALLKVYAQCEPTPPPAAFVLCIRGESFELGEPLSAPATANLAVAQVFLQGLLNAEEVDWAQHCT
ncbi:MAG: hydrogenase maturation protease [Gallionella sp.]